MIRISYCSIFISGNFQPPTNVTLIEDIDIFTKRSLSLSWKTLASPSSSSSCHTLSFYIIFTSRNMVNITAYAVMSAGMVATILFLTYFFLSEISNFGWVRKRLFLPFETCLLTNQIYFPLKVSFIHIIQSTIHSHPHKGF